MVGAVDGQGVMGQVSVDHLGGIGCPKMVNRFGYESHGAIAGQKVSAARMEAAEPLCPADPIGIPGVGLGDIIQFRMAMTDDYVHPTGAATGRIPDSDPGSRARPEGLSFAHRKRVAGSIQHIGDPDTAIAKEDAGVRMDARDVTMARNAWVVAQSGQYWRVQGTLHGPQSIIEIAVLVNAARLGVTRVGWADKTVEGRFPECAAAVSAGEHGLQRSLGNAESIVQITLFQKRKR